MSLSIIFASCLYSYAVYYLFSDCFLITPVCLACDKKKCVTKTIEKLWFTLMITSFRRCYYFIFFFVFASLPLNGFTHNMIWHLFPEILYMCLCFLFPRRIFTYQFVSFNNKHLVCHCDTERVYKNVKKYIDLPFTCAITGTGRSWNWIVSVLQLTLVHKYDIASGALQIK